MQLETYKEGIKLYNSQNTSKQMLKDNFVIRLREYKKIWKAISESTMQTPEQHFIVQGVRGSGKTTLLSRLAVEIADDESLSKWLIPIVFKEEEYGISSLFGLWERVAEELEESDENLFGELLTKVESLQETDPKQALNLLDFYLKKANKKITLFIDNLVELFENFTPLEHDILREVLITNNNIRIIGGSAKSLELFFDYKAPFYQFFNVLTLKGLKQKDTIALLTKLSEHGGEEEQTKLNLLLETEPEKIESIRRLTGGIPRTMVILFNILMEGPKGKTYTLLEETIDKTTLLYKHRMDDLSKQHKPIVNAIALNWDAMSAKEIAEKTRLSSKQVSAQLSQLEKQWIIEKIPTNTKNNLYAIKERFFNIWYLMRYGRRKDKKKVIWLTQFFEIWCTGDELVNRTAQFIKGLDETAHPQAALTFANALMCSNMLEVTDKQVLFSTMEEFLLNSGNQVLKRQLVQVDSDELESEINENLVQLLNLPDELNESLIKLVKQEGAFLIKGLKLLNSKEDEAFYKGERLLLEINSKLANLMLSGGYSKRKMYEKSENIFLDRFEYSESKALKMVAVICRQNNENEGALKYYLRAVDAGAPDCYVSISELYLESGRVDLCEKYARLAKDDGEEGFVRCLISSLYLQNKYEEALSLCLLDIEKGYEVTHSCWMASQMYFEQNELDAALEYIEKAIENENRIGELYTLQARVLFAQNRLQDALKSAEQALNLGDLEANILLAKLNLKLGRVEKVDEILSSPDVQDSYDILSHLLNLCITDAICKSKALEFSARAQKFEDALYERTDHVFVLLWNCKFDEATSSMKEFLSENIDDLDELESDFIDLFIFFMAKGQYNLVDQWLKEYQLVDRLKPLYYALMSLMRDKYPNEILRMGSELQETVDEILVKVEDWREKYK